MVDRSTAAILGELTGGGATSLHSHAGAGASIAFPNSEAYSGASPDAAWADLNLSSVVGSNQAWVWLAIHAGADMNATAVRRNGDAVEYYDPSADAAAQGVACAHHDNTNAVVLACATDSSGVIEWITETTQNPATVTVLAYIK